MGAYVFRKSLLRAVANIETAKIHANCERRALFRPVRSCLHETPHEIEQTDRAGVGAGTTKQSYSPGSSNGQRFSACKSTGDQNGELQAIGEPDTEWYSRSIDRPPGRRENWLNSENSN